MYDLKEIIKKPNAEPDPSKMIKPTNIFEWPNLHDQHSSRERKLKLDVYDILINKTALSYNSKYLVEFTNNNMVSI